MAWSLTAIAGLAALVLWLPGCLPGCASCTDKPGCNGNEAVLCLSGVDPDGPDTYNLRFACPGGTTCTERPGTGDQPVCVIGDGQPCDMTKEEQCVDGVPAACVSLPSGKDVFASNLATNYVGCRQDQTCALSGQLALCVSTSLGSCGKDDDEACVHGVPAVCLELDDNSFIWTASFTSYYQTDEVTRNADGHCPSGSTCTQIGDTTDCVLDGDVACKHGSRSECTSADVVSSCIQLDDGTFVKDSQHCKDCVDVEGNIGCD